MKAVLAPGVAALALALAGCGSSGNEAASTAGNAAPLPRVAAPNHGDWTETVSTTDRGGFLMGNPDAPVKLLEYASISCPYCGRFSTDAFQPLTSRYVRSGQVSWEYRPFLIHGTDPAVFMLLRCAGPAAFFHLSEQLYATQAEWAGKAEQLPQDEQQRLQALDPQAQAAALARVTGIDQFFRQRGLPDARINACLADAGNLNQLGKISRRASSEEGVTGTPSFFINGQKKEAGTWAELEPLLRAAVGG
jgi:protein-disulfide isomerase